jgi:hypothetical protein
MWMKSTGPLHGLARKPTVRSTGVDADHGVSLRQACDAPASFDNPLEISHNNW